MIINCESCGTTYRIDPETLKDDQNVTTCKECGHQIVLENSRISASAADDPFDVLDDFSPSQPSKPAGPADEPPDVVDGFAKAASADTTDASPRVEPKAPDKGTAPLPGGRSGLHIKLAFLMALAALVPLVLFAVLAYQFSNTRLHTQLAELGTRSAARATTQAATGLTDQVDGWMAQNVRMLKTVAQLPNIIIIKWREKAPLLDATIKEYPWVRQIVTLDSGKNNVGDIGNPPLIDFSTCPCVNAVSNGKSVAWNTMMDEKTGKPMLVMAVPVIGPHGEIDGIVASLIDLDGLIHPMIRWTQENNALAFLVDEKTNSILRVGDASPADPKTNPSEMPLMKALHKGEKGPIFYKNTHGIPSVGQVIRTTSGWAVAIQMEDKEALARLPQGKSKYVSLLGAALVLGLLMTLLFSSLFLKPIKALVRTANRISLGELDHELAANRKDELGDLAQAISRMQASIRLSMGRLRHNRRSS